MSRFVALAVLVLALPALAAKPPAERLLTEEDLEGIAWRSIGPANMGGRVAAIGIVPGSRTSFYVGFGTGGVWKTTNLGVTFSPVFDKYGVHSIGAIAVADAPADWPGWGAEDEKAGKPLDRAEAGKGRIVWVGTGEGNGRNSSSWGNGVYRSTDGGETFTHLGLEETHDIPRVAVDPRNPEVAYVAALGRLWGANPERGVFKTDNGGRTWQHVLKVDTSTGAADVVIDPRSPDTVFAALYARRRTPWSFSGNSETGGIFRSDNAGRSWRKLTRGLPLRTGRIGLTIFPGDTRILYAVVESDHGGTGRDPFEDRSPSGGLFKSEDGGETWQRVSELSFRPFYFARVAVDPEDANRVYMPGWDLAVSDDGGRTFRRSGSEHVHVDFHAIAVNPADPKQIIVGNDGGVYVSHDRARTWDYLNHIAVGQFYQIAVDMSDPYRVAGGLQDNLSWVGPSETLYYTEDTNRDGILNQDWRRIGGGDGFTVAFDPTDPNLVYTTSQGGWLVRTRLDNGLQRIIRPSPDEGEERLRFNWNAPFVVSKHDPSVIYHAGNKVFKLTERGDKWFAISPDLTRNEPGRTNAVGSDAETYGTIVALAESPRRAGVLWAGSDDGRIHVTRDDGGSWADVTPKEVGGLYVSGLFPSHFDEATTYAAVDGHRMDVFRPLVLVTRNSGRSWTSITGDLPEGGPVHVVIEDPASADVLFVGTEFGAFVSVDRGAHWVKLNGKSLPPAPVHDMVVHPRERDLIAGTHGRSVWILDDAAFFAGLTAETRAKALALLPFQPARPRQLLAGPYGAGHGLFRGKNPPIGAGITFWVGEAAGASYKIAIADAGDGIVRELEGVTRRGVNRIVWDLQADPKHRFDGVDEQQLGQRQYVPAGDYEVTVTVEDEKAKGSVTVQAAPAW